MRTPVSRLPRHFLRRLFPLCLLGLLVLGAHAQFSGPAVGLTPQPLTTDQTIISPAVQDVHIGPGDLVTVKLFGVADYTPISRVSVDGSIQLPLIGLVRVAGLTVEQAENLIAERLIAERMYRNPQVVVQVTEPVSQFATVGGEMHAIVPLVGARRLLDVLAQAGPIPISASHVVTILRPGLPKPIIVDLGTDPALSGAANIQILPRDTILLSRVGVVYVLGAFTRQGAIPLDQNSPLTLMQLTALSGGEGFEGKYKDLRIIRTEGTERKVVKTDLKRVVDGKDPDPVLQANDIVFLPTDPLKAALKSGGIQTILSVASILLISLQNRGN